MAERVGGEIIGCDALQVYRDFDAATAKPAAEERLRVRHHLVDFVDPRRDYTLADYVRDADAAIADINARRATPIVVGGTGLYLRGLMKGIVEAPARDEKLRARLRDVTARHGSPRLHRWLSALDPVSAARLAPADAQRVIRAIELALAGGRSWSERLEREGTWKRAPERYATLKIGMDLERAELHQRIEARVKRFFERGLVEEVRDLLARCVPPTANAFKAIGYREVLAALIAGRDPLEVRDDVVRATRRYSKRQRTWFRREPGILWLDAAEGPESAASRIAGLWSAPQGNAR